MVDLTVNNLFLNAVNIINLFVKEKFLAVYDNNYQVANTLIDLMDIRMMVN